MAFWICKKPGDRGSAHKTREEAAEGIRELFDAGLARRGEFYVVETDSEGSAVRTFSVDDEVAPPRLILAWKRLRRLPYKVSVGVKEARRA